MKTINATLGKNCSTSTKKPLQVRYIKFTSNSSGNPIQISQLVVMAFINGVQGNVAPRGTVASSPGIDNMDNRIPLNGKTDNKLYWSSNSGREGIYWQLDLGAEFPLTSITYYNRDDNNRYANGMTIDFMDGNGNIYNLKNGGTLTGQLVQTFNVSVDDVIMNSPFYMNAPRDFKVSSENRVGLWWYGINSLADGETECSKRGQRVCRKDEVQNYDWREANMGFAVYTDNRIGLPNKHRLSEFVDTDWVDFGENPPGNRTGIVCCDIDHTGAYDPIINPMTVGFYS